LADERRERDELRQLEDEKQRGKMEEEAAKFQE